MSPTARPAPVRKRMNADQRREHIVDAARKVFIAHGFGGSRIRDIAAEAGVNEALLYRHFDSKEALFEAAVVEPLQVAVAHLVVAATEPPASSDAPTDVMIERTRLFLEDLVAVMRDVAPLLGVMLFSGEGPAATHYQTIVAPVLEQITGIVGQNLGWWDHRSFDPDRIVRVLFGAVWFEVASMRLTDGNHDLGPYVAELADAIILGLASRA